MKRTITYKIIISYIVIILISFAIVAAIFNISVKGYMERKLLEELKENAMLISGAIGREFDNMKRNHRNQNLQIDNPQVSNPQLNNSQVNNSQVNNSQIDNPQIGNPQMLRGMLRRTLMNQDVTFFFLTSDMKQVLPVTVEEANVFEKQILPVVKKRLEKESNGYFKVWIDKKENIGVFMQTGINARRWIVLYTPLKMAYEIGRGMWFVLLIPLAFTGTLATVFGIFFARSMAKPIVMLKNRAEMLSKRDFDSKVDIHTGDELEELANTINKMADELKEYDIAQKRFLQNASHELKTPLMSIQGYAEGIKDGVFDNNEQALDIIVEESTRLKSIVEELIFLSKLETMEDFYMYDDESMNEIIGKSIEKINSIAVKSNIRINQMPGRDARLKVDRDKFTQALINILGNCLRYAVREVDVATATSNDGRVFEIRISDDGDGFDEKEIKNIFERFYKGKKGDTGLGLAITKVIIEKHGGSIEVANSRTGGAEFIIRLNIKQG